MTTSEIAITVTEQPRTQPTALKIYVKPVVKKGPILSNVSADLISGGGGGGCWIARAAFGMDDFRWMIFRAWLLEDAPDWFRGLYFRFGERLGTWVNDRETVRGLVRGAMLPVIRRKLVGR